MPLEYSTGIKRGFMTFLVNAGITSIPTIPAHTLRMLERADSAVSAGYAINSEVYAPNIFIITLVFILGVLGIFFVLYLFFVHVVMFLVAYFYYLKMSTVDLLELRLKFKKSNMSVLSYKWTALSRALEKKGIYI
tara:strand:- start:2242 stop:2646 length:405 start_codon:yes stop_codon:yes gene_type:complete